MFLNSLKIAFKFTKELKYKKLFWLILFFSRISIILGSSILILGLSLTNGFENELKNKIFEFIPHGTIDAINPPYVNWKNDLNIIKKKNGIINVFPYINFTAILEKKNKLKMIQIIGIHSIPKKLVNLNFNNSKLHTLRELELKKNEIILGKKISKFLNVSTGDFIKIQILKHKKNTNYKKIKQFFFKITNIYKLNNIIENQIAYISLKSAQEILKYKHDEITGFQIKVNNIFDAEKLIYNIGMRLNQWVNIKSWNKNYENFYNDIKIMRIIIYLSMILVLFISSFSIFSILMIFLKNKIFDIIILKTLGAKNSFIFSIFILYSLIISIPGCLIGVLLGIFISFNLKNIMKFIFFIFQNYPLEKNIDFVNFLPSILNIKDVFYVIFITLFFSLLFSIYPYKKALEIKPIKILNS